MTEEIPNEDSSGRDVFVSYSSQDVAVADAIVAALEKNGIKCWIAPRDVTPGALYADGIIRAINDSTVMALVLSASAIASKHVGKEVERASSKGRPIIALKVDATPLTTALEYFLSESQWIDVAALGMPGALAKLTQAVGLALSTESGVSPAVGADVGNAGSPSTKRPDGTKWVALAAAVLFAVVSTVGVVHFWSPKHAEAQAPAVSAISDKSIAVLPFADMSQKKDQEYFGDGMAEEILDLLAKIPGLTVIGRTSSFAFKGKNEDLRKIGQELNAAYVLEGSVRSSGDQVRITAQLINTRTGAHEWSETYDRPIGDVLKLQDAIASAVVRELQLTVAPDFLNSRASVNNTDAYDLLLRGRHAYDRWDAEGLDEAVTLLKRALALDPTFAEAEAWLARVYEAQGEFGFLAPATAFEEARRGAAKALQLDPRSAEAHVVLGNIYIVYDWDWNDGERERQQAISIAPGDLHAQRLEAIHSLTLGHWDDALRQIKALIAQDPFDPVNFAYLATIHDRLGHVAEAEAALRRVLDIRSTFVWAHYYLGRVMLAHGDRDAALVEMQQETSENPQKGGLAMAYHALGRKADSDAALASMVRDQAADNAFGIAEVYSFRGQLNEAMQWLERAFAQKDPNLYSVKGDPVFKSLEADPRYKAFLKKMNLPE